MKFGCDGPSSFTEEKSGHVVDGRRRGTLEHGYITS